MACSSVSKVAAITWGGEVSAWDAPNFWPNDSISRTSSISLSVSFASLIFLSSSLHSFVGSNDSSSRKTRTRGNWIVVAKHQQSISRGCVGGRTVRCTTPSCGSETCSAYCRSPGIYCAVPR
jgi:hypothetical protein